MVHVARIRYKRNTYQVLGDNNKEGKHLKDLLIDGRLILKQRLLTGFSLFAKMNQLLKVVKFHN